MNEMFIKLLEIYKSPFLVFSGRFEFTSLYNLILLTIFIGASAWLIKKAWPIAANTGQSRSIFVDNITKENLIDKLIRINRGFSNALPGIFIGLGILGTFVGLTFGLREIDFGSTNPIRQSMKQLLDVMLIAFSTSVWGITLSICFSSLEKWMENKLETEILHLQEDINKLFSSKPLEVYLKDLLEASWEQSRVLKSFSTDLEGPAKGGLGGVVKYLDKIKSILFSAIVRSSSSDLSGLSRLAVG